MLAARDQQRVEAEARHELGAPLDQFLLARAMTDDGFELAQIGRQKRRAAIALEIGALRIDQNTIVPRARASAISPWQSASVPLS